MSDPDPTPTSEPAPAPPVDPGERLLAHPPSDRYRAAAGSSLPTEEPDTAASIPRGYAIATVAAIVGAVAIVVLGGVLTMTMGLLAVSGAIGWGVAIGLRFGAGGHLSRRRRWMAAVALSLGAVTLGQLGLWQYARTEGGVLSPLDYLGEVYGPLVPLEFGAAALVAWLTAR